MNGLTAEDPIEALVQECYSRANNGGYGAVLGIDEIRAFAGRVLEVGGQQPGVPVEKVRALHLSLMGQRDRWTDGILGWDMLTDFIADVAALLPEEPTS